MSSTKVSIIRNVVDLAIILIVFGFAALMVLERYGPAVIEMIVTATCLGAAELVRLFQARLPARTDSDEPAGKQA